MAEILIFKKTKQTAFSGLRGASDPSNPVVQDTMLAQSTSIRLSNWMIRHSAWQSFSQVEWEVRAHIAGWVQRGLTRTFTVWVDFDWRIYIKYQCFVLSCGVCWPTYDREEKTCRFKIRCYSKHVNPEGRKSNRKGFYMYEFLGKQNGFSQKFQRKSYSEIHQQNIRLHVSIVNYWRGSLVTLVYAHPFLIRWPDYKYWIQKKSDISILSPSFYTFVMSGERCFVSFALI